jgi:arylsulfatase A-like enzyme
VPFFLFVNYMDPHEPYAPPEPFRSRFAPGVDPEMGFIRYDPRSGKIISTEEFVRDVVPTLTPHDWDDLRALYDGEVAFLDDQVGRVVAKLKALGLYDRTLVVVTADHGELFGEHGLATHFKSLSEEEIHVPLIVRYPPRIAAATRVATTVELVDVLPTVLEATGLPPPQGLDGRSLLGAVGPGAERTDAEAHSYLLRKPNKRFPHTAPGDLVALRTAAFKYVWSSTGRNLYYNLALDPRAENDGYEGDSVLLAAIAQRVEAWRRAVGLDTVGREPVDPLTEQRLRSLGYVH